jgi:hypothetical protein
MDDERLKRAGGGNYFDELLVRFRDIRSSEKVFWRKVLDIYATSIDNDPKPTSPASSSPPSRRKRLQVPSRVEEVFLADGEVI